MKKLYIEPEIEFVKFVLKNEVLFHSAFESGGKNLNWDWDPGEEPLPDPDD